MLNATLCPSPIVPEHVLDRHLHIVEHQRGRRRAVEPELVLVGAADHAHAALDDEGGEVLAVDLGEHGEDVGEAAVGDPQLLAAEAVELAVRRQRGGGARRRAHPSRLRARSARRRRSARRWPAAAGIAARCSVVAEIDDRQRADAGVGAERSGERRDQTQLLADAGGADLVEAEAAVGFRNLETGEVAIGGFLDQLARQHPILGVQLRRARQHFRAHELLGGAAEQQLLFGQILAGEHRVGSGVAGQEPAAPAAHTGIEINSHGPVTIALGSLVSQGKRRRAQARWCKLWDAKCVQSQSCSISPAASPSSPAARAGWARKWPRASPRPGASLMLCARREQWLTPTLETFRGRGFTVEGMVCDVSVPEQVQAVVDKTIATYGKVDILVNNAGISWGAEPEDMPLEKWQKVIDINLTGAFLFSQAAGREMLKNEIRPHHQHRVDCRHPRVRERRALRRLRREQGRA